MPEVASFICWRAAQWQRSRYYAHASHTVEAAQEVDTDIDTERLLEILALPPPLRRIVLVELIGERDLLDVARRQQPDLVNHAGQTASSICSTRETEYADSVAFFVGVHQEMIRISYVESQA